VFWNHRPWRDQEIRKDGSRQSCSHHRRGRPGSRSHCNAAGIGAPCDRCRGHRRDKASLGVESWRDERRRRSCPDNVTDLILQAAGAPIFYAIDFVNISRTASFGYNALGKGGLLVLVGVAGGELDLSLAGMVFTARGVISSNAVNLDDMKEVIDLAKAGKLMPIPIERMPIEEVNRALEKLASGRVTGRLVLESRLSE
jgi:D-arabinose 1-dehydrogenase-like Zn-dependent alcohol dehydrogenase